MKYQVATRPQVWMIIGAALFIVNGYDLVSEWIGDNRLSFSNLFFSLTGLIIFFVHLSDYRKKRSDKAPSEQNKHEKNP